MNKRERILPSRGKILLAVVFTTALSALAALNTRTDIDPSGFPTDWDVSNRTTYQVDVASTTFETLDTASISVVAQTFDLDSCSSGLVVTFR